MAEDLDALSGGETLNVETVPGDLAALVALEPVAEVAAAAAQPLVESVSPAESDTAILDSAPVFHATVSDYATEMEAPRLAPLHLVADGLHHHSLPVIEPTAAPTPYHPRDSTASRAEPVSMASAAGSATETPPPNALSGNVSKGTVAGTGWESVYIDTLISGVKLQATGPIHYYLADTGDQSLFNAEYGSGKLYDWSGDQKSAAEQMFQLYENVTALQFVETTDYNDADIVWWQSNASFFTNYFGAPGFVGFNEFPDSSHFLPLYGVFDHDYFDDTMFQGGDGFLVMMHELGHGLGLAHPHDGYNGNETFPGVSSSSDEGTNLLNQQIWTEMSYNRGWDDAPWTMNYGGVGTPMTLDIAALQDIYGANLTFAGGDDIYDLPTANAKGAFWTALWDTGGSDTIDGSASKNTVIIDLREAPLSGPNAGGYVSWQKGIGGGFTIANGVVIENAIGGSGADTITGNDADNTLTGNGGNDSLDGGLGADALIGGGGNDTYWLDDAGDTVTEGASAGIDMVNASIDVDLADPNFTGEIEKITLLTGATNAIGNGLNNSITGNDAANRIDGGAGNDNMSGGKGDDTYVVDSAADRVIESTAGGTDTVESAVAFSLALLANVENLTLTGADAVDGTGNSLANSLMGNGNDNLLDGRGGVDTFDGGAGDDTYVVDNAVELTQITDAAGSDTIKTALKLTAPVADIENYINTGTLAWSLDLSVHGTEANLITGGSAVDTLIGGDGKDVLNGGLGGDVLNGGADADTYVIDNLKDKILDSDSGNSLFINRTIDLDKTFIGLFAAVTLTGTAALNIFGDAGDNTLTGNAGNNILDGRDGADTLIGGAGNDTYFFGAGDTIVEDVNAGTDTVKSSVTVDLTAGTLAGQQIENIVLVPGAGAIDAVGNGSNNLITGNAFANTLDGGAGNDTLTGGKGDDLYRIDSAADKIVELAGGGIDTVESAVTFSLAALGNVEKLTLTGVLALNATGNALANTLTSNGNDNVLDGKSGADTLAGGAGNDIYIIDNANDKILESVSEGHDLAKSSVSFALAADVEDLILTGTAAISGTGNADDNAITGNAGRNVIIGGGGDDSLTGGLGIDTFKYKALSDGGSGHELVTDFVRGTGGDILDLHDLLTSIGTTASHAVTDGYLQFTASGSDTLVEIDADGGGDGFATLVTLVGITLQAADTVNLRL